MKLLTRAANSGLRTCALPRSVILSSILLPKKLHEASMRHRRTLSLSASRCAQREIDLFKGKAKPNYRVGSYVPQISSLRRVNQDEGGVRCGPTAVRNDREVVEISASFEACYAPLSYLTAGRGQQGASLPRYLVMIMAVTSRRLALTRMFDIEPCSNRILHNVKVTRVSELEMPHLEMWR